MMRPGIYRDHAGRTVVAEKWDGGYHPDVRQHGESDAFVWGAETMLPIHVGEWIVTTESGARQVWTEQQFGGVFEPLLRVPA